MDTFIPVQRAQIEWRIDAQRRVQEAVVFDKGSPPPRGARHKLFKQSGGACVADWMSGDDPRSTPEGVFIQMAYAGFSEADAMLQTLEEFGKIDACNWARTMRAALASRLNAERA